MYCQPVERLGILGASNRGVDELTAPLFRRMRHNILEKVDD
jgi:hypothetical protein